MQPAGPGVIPEALPLQPHLIQRRRGQALDSGKRLHPTRPVGERHGQLGLLQHHLGNPDAVGIEILIRRWTRAARQLLPGDAAAAMALPPGQQGCRQNSSIGLGQRIHGFAIGVRTGPEQRPSSKCFTRQDARAQQAKA